MRAAAAVGLAFFALYLATLPPALAPYRDTGEMSLAAQTLSVAHPTSYPLYVQLAHAAGLVPLGNRAYRLGLLSSAAGALALALVFFLCRRRWGWEAGVCAALLLGLDPTYWSIVQVQEMYSLWVLGAALLMGLAWELHDAPTEKLWLAFCFTFGLCLTNRLDILLWAPGLLAATAPFAGAAPVWAGFAFLVVPTVMILSGSNAPIVVLIVGTVLWFRPRERGLPWLYRGLGFALLGLSCYLFLPIRSAQGPFLDWNHPAAAANFLESLLRTRYGGTLDLLSKNYAKGELFGENLWLYGRHLFSSFSVLGLAVVLWGSYRCARSQPRRWLGMAVAYWWSGPVFLFMANLPPNPHAAAIVEPHYLLSDLILVFWAGEFAPRRFSAAVRAVFLGLLIAVPYASGHFTRFNRRTHLFSYDYAKNIFRSIPPGGTLVAKKDVQLYALWHYQTVQGWRPDASLVSQGLSGSPWYQAGLRRARPGLFLSALRDEAGWLRFRDGNPVVMATMDTEVPESLLKEGQPRGLLTSLGKRPAPEVPWDLMSRRGRYEYEGQVDFFTSDLVDAYAQALHRAGTRAFISGRAEEAVTCLERAWSMHWLFPEPAVFLGYIAFTRGDLEGARRYYAAAGVLSDALLGLSEEYHSLPDLKANLKRSAGDAQMQLGVVSERLKDYPAAQAAYLRSLALYPTAQTHYNLAVLFWGRDWARAESELVEALRLDPRHAEAARYLQQARLRKR